MGYIQIKTEQPTPTDLKRFKAILLAKQREILANVISLENETLHRSVTELSPSDIADLAADNCELENTLGLVGSERNILWEILDALARIESGTYGVCEGNGEPIPRARLRAIPWARYCVHCASLNERGLLFIEPDSDDSEDIDGNGRIRTDESHAA